MASPYDWWMKWRESNYNGKLQWELIAPSGKNAATVFENGVWHTWDENGCGGENSSEATVKEAMRQAMASVLVQGHHTSDGGSRVPCDVAGKRPRQASTVSCSDR